VSIDEGTVVELVTERPATGGAVARLEDGRVAFVRLALPGERVSARVTSVHKRFVRAEATEVIDASNDRVTPPCEYAGAGKCGGCDLQHATDAAQRAWKSAIITDHLHRIAGIDRHVEVTAAPSDPRGSRTRLRCGVDGHGRLGLRQSASNDVVALDDCWLADSRLQVAFNHRWEHAREVELRAIGSEEPFAVVHARRGGVEQLLATTLTGEPLARAGSVVHVGAHRFEIGPLSFWQSHRDAPRLLSELVVSALGAATGDRVVDLYSGVGLFAVPVADVVGATGRVDAVESSPDAAHDLRRNARGFDRLRTREWLVTPRAINDLVYEGSLVVLDPPRSGAGAGVMAALTKRGPRRIVYVSCDAATFARDVKEARRGGFELTSLIAHDLFPMTEHVELVGVLDGPP